MPGSDSDLQCSEFLGQQVMHSGGGAHLAGAQGADRRARAHGIPLRQASIAPEVGRQLRAVHLEELCGGLELHQRAVQGLLEVGILCLGRILQHR